MGYIKEPEGIDFVVDPTPLNRADRKKISEIISYYKATGRKMPSDDCLPAGQSHRKKKSTKKTHSASATKKKVFT